MKTTTIGRSTSGRAIEVIAKTEKFDEANILVLSGLHGDETEGIVLNQLILRHFAQTEKNKLQNLMFIPMANPDGAALHQRWNMNNVDLNRNWPTRDWTPHFTNPRYPPGPKAESEIETEVLRKFIEQTRIDIVIDLHSFAQSAVLPTYYRENSKLDKYVHDLASSLNLRVDYAPDSLGYSIAGGFHTWCSEKQIQNITIEIEKGLGQFAIEKQYLPPLAQFINNLLV